VEQIIQLIEAGWQEGAYVQPQTIVLPPMLVVRRSSLRKKE
jgi:hypothetical protein